MRLRCALVAALTVGSTLGLPLSGLLPAAHADETVVVHGTAFPSSSTYLTYFGCVDLFHADTRGPLVRVTRDAGAPLGSRAAGLEVPGAGTAVGSVSLVGSVADATSSMSVRAAAGSSGVAYVWYVAPGLKPGEVWSGRADLTAGADGWQQIDAAAASYTWTRVEAATGAVRKQAGVATMAGFAAEHGDGPGYLLSGLGCDGRGFGLDALRVGTPGAVTTYDLEGWSVSTSISASSEKIIRGGDVTLGATSVDAAATPMGAALVLEARPEGAGDFKPVTGPVLAGPDGRVTATVTPEVTTDYRWFFAERAYADAHWSATTRVVVEEPAGR
ncbi:MAG: hypothetical protein ACXWDM_07840 [Nocardioides sp.]